MSSSPFILYWVQGFWGGIREIERDAHNTNKSFEKADFIVAVGKTTNKRQLTNIASNVGIMGFGLLVVNKSSTSPNSSSLDHVSDGFF